MISKIFIQRPITAIVFSIFLLIVGVLSLLRLPISEFPLITPPVISVAGVYPGANSSTVEEAITTPIENQINGVQNMMYIQSSSTNNGSFTINIAFEPGTNIDIAALDVQNRVSLAQPSLPEEVKRIGISVTKASNDILQFVALTSPDNRYDKKFLDNYTIIYIKKSLARIKGVGKVENLGSANFAMRVWLNPQKMSCLNITPQQVIQAINEQNAQVAAGSIGQSPIPKGQSFEYTVRVEGRLNQSEEFEDIIISQNPQSGALTRLKDLARVELGSTSYSGSTRISGKTVSGLAIFQSPYANAIETNKLVQAEMKRLEKNFPPGLQWSVSYDTTRFVDISIKEVIKTFLEALLLVLMIVFLFLQSWRATLIPMLAVPVSIIGTFAFFSLLGFTINTLTLFGLVLAIGIVVDDAIIVVEAVQHHIDHYKLPAKEATLRAMRKVGGPVIAIALILCAVFVPVVFMPGVTGRLYQQFAITIAISISISAVVALTLTPALCALMMRPNPVNKESKGIYKYFYRFNIWFEKQTTKYGKAVQRSIARLPLMVILLIVIMAGTSFLGKMLPTSFIPNEDKGYVIISVELPSAASEERTRKVMDKIDQILNKNPFIKESYSISSFSMLNRTNASNAGTFFVILKPWGVRNFPAGRVEQITSRIQKEVSQIKEANILTLTPPAIQGLGSTGGFSLMIKQASGTVQELNLVKDSFLKALQQHPDILYAFSSFKADYPEIELIIDREKAKKLGLTLNDINLTLQTFLGSFYINDFNLYNKTFKVIVQAEGQFRNDISKLSQYYVRNQQGIMIPLSTVLTHKKSTGAMVIPHYNLERAVEINGQGAPWKSSGDALKALKETAEKNLPQGYTYEFSGISKQEIEAGNKNSMIVGLSLLFVFLLLAALYENWSVPFAVLLSVPIGALGAFLTIFLAKMTNSIYTQIGLVTLTGLAAKNAILIVEFCKTRYEQGEPLIQAVVHAAMLRLRPILMTSLAFILGVMPLMFSSGAGASARINLSYPVFGGMLLATTLGIFFVPALYILVIRMSRKKDYIPEKKLLSK